MKHLRLIFKILITSCFISVVSSCGDVKGTFYLMDDVNAYMIDTTSVPQYFMSQDSISECFTYNPVYSGTHHYFMEWGMDGDAWGEMFSMHLHSSLNSYRFEYTLWAGTDDTDLLLDWGGKYFYYSFMEKKITSHNVACDINFQDSILIDNTIYYHIIEVNYSEDDSPDMPQDLIISGEQGLLRFSFANGVVYTRTFH